mmetsp:Transcript_85945/g.239178  ORF Transcript_85945/g.239178 Transcript_85945/m.239178 type:complete len:229 (+) Transcript_85945:245-931(+)
MPAAARAARAGEIAPAGSAAAAAAAASFPYRRPGTRAPAPASRRAPLDAAVGGPPLSAANRGTGGRRRASRLPGGEEVPFPQGAEPARAAGSERPTSCRRAEGRGRRLRVGHHARALLDGDASGLHLRRLRQVDVRLEGVPRQPLGGGPGDHGPGGADAADARRRDRRVLGFSACCVDSRRRGNRLDARAPLAGRRRCVPGPRAARLEPAGLRGAQRPDAHVERRREP